MEAYYLARAIHVLAIVHWIGGVFFVTCVLMPALKKKYEPKEWFPIFESLENSFAFQAKISTVLAGLSGFYLFHYMNIWSRLLELKYWYMHTMILTWFLFTMMLFVLEPFYLHKKLLEMAQKNPIGTMKKMQNMHYVLLALALITIFGIKLAH